VITDHLDGDTSWRHSATRKVLGISKPFLKLWKSRYNVQVLKQGSGLDSWSESDEQRGGADVRIDLIRFGPTTESESLIAP
jgi:hypothetical protein